MKTITISEYGLLGCDDSVENFNKFKSAKIDRETFKELEEFAKNEGSEIFAFRGKYLQAKSYVGLIELKNGTIIEILPKIYNDNNEVKIQKQVFINLLKILYNLPSYKFLESGKFDIEKMPLLEIFIKMFLDEVEYIIKKGLKSDYITNEDNLNYYKGKLLINKQISKNFIHKNKFYCEFDEYHLNRSENKLIKTTLKYLSSKSQNLENKKRIRMYVEHLYEVELSKNIYFDFRNIKINRGTKHYKNALIWAKIFLKNNTFSSFSGDKEAFSILYPMERLFENYVGYLLKNKNEIKNLKFQKQKTFVKNLLSSRPDFVYKFNEEKIIGDAKWKNIDINNSKTLSQNDFYQLFAYSKIFNSKKLKLFYPRNEKFDYEEFEGKKFEYFDATEIEILSIDMMKLINKDY